MNKDLSRVSCVILFVLCASVSLGDTTNDASNKDKVLSTEDLSHIRHTVETLRGKKFRRDLPVYNISNRELRAMVDREVDKELPGRKLTDYQELLGWLDILPPGTELKAIYADFLVDQMMGMYDSKMKEMYLRAPIGAKPTVPKSTGAKTSAKEKRGGDTTMDNLVLVHEFTHALEDQHYIIEDPEERERHDSTDRQAARNFLFEGTAMRIMTEAMPAETGGRSAMVYREVWNILHTGLAEAILDYLMRRIWKGDEAKVAGVPEVLSRVEVMAYAYGYSFCTGVMRDWGLDGLDYMCDHTPVSSEQLMHPEKAWAWRDFPVKIALPETLPGGWKRLSDETFGEAGMAVFFGCFLTNLNRGLWIARGWDGDRAALYVGPENSRLLVIASAWDTAADAECFTEYFKKHRVAVHRASIADTTSTQFAWTRLDGRSGMLLREGKRVLIFESARAGAMRDLELWRKTITYNDPPEDAARAEANNVVLLFNPLLSQSKDGEYVVTKFLGGLLSRHDRNAVGASDQILLGLAGESRRTASLNKWQLGWGQIARHETEARRSFTKTTVLPCGILANHYSSPMPQNPTNIISRTSVLWGLAGSQNVDERGRRVFRILPGGLLCRSTRDTGYRSFHILGTGLSQSDGSGRTGAKTRFRLLGIPVWTSAASSASKAE